MLIVSKCRCKKIDAVGIHTDLLFIATLDFENVVENKHILIVNATMNSTVSSLYGGYNIVQAAKQPVIYTYSVTIPLIVITSILNICVLCHRAFRLSPCTYYFLASVPPSLVYVVVTPLNAIISTRFGFYITGTFVTCKIVDFLVFTTSLLYASMLVCATIDRYFSSSTSVRLRRFSQVRVARRIIIIVWTLVFLYMSPLLIIYYYDTNSTSASKCTQYSTILSTVYLTTRVILYYFLIPIILGIFGSLTIYNIQNQMLRVAPVNRTIVNRRTEGQMARMLIIQVAVYFLFFMPAGVTYTLVTFVPSMNTPYYLTIRMLAVVWQSGGYFISFFCYILSGKIYREQLKKIFKCNRICHRIF
jgi:hypothetical protein